jgi:hypothetical protein
MECRHFLTMANEIPLSDVVREPSLLLVALQMHKCKQKNMLGGGAAFTNDVGAEISCAMYFEAVEYFPELDSFQVIAFVAPSVSFTSCNLLH